MRNDQFEGLVEGLREALGHVQGDEAPGLIVHIPPEIDVKAIRGALRLTQPQFAARFGFSIGAVRDWEQGRAVPDQSTRAYLKVIRAEPATVVRVLEAT